jgi:hypothetical protein
VDLFEKQAKVRAIPVAGRDKAADVRPMHPDDIVGRAADELDVPDDPPFYQRGGPQRQKFKPAARNKGPVEGGGPAGHFHVGHSF